ncbi:c-type cytochrome [Marinobacter sp. C2H3]|uniref:c-type cytochrome n=1 Tax=Marinobacter sp. C2H3 TaxID=3119003 RepID=UPI00300EA009
MIRIGLLLWMTLLAGNALAISVEDEIRQRIAPVGEVCLQGQGCGRPAPGASAGAEPRSGEAVYTSVCSACHGAGIAGAPKMGDKAAWAPRIEQGLETLIQHAINGIRGMPPKGGCANCPDEEIGNAVTYMVDQSQ